MKKNLYLIAGLLSTFLVSCSQDDTVSGNVEKTASLQILFGNSGVQAPVQAGTRNTATALPTATDEATLGRVAIGVFNSDGSTNTIAESTATSTVISMNCAPATGCTVVVVGNAPAGFFAGVATKDAFLKKEVALSTMASGALQTSTALPFSGEKSSINLTAGQTSNVTVDLTRLVSRISLESINISFPTDGLYKDAKFIPQGVFLYDALSTSCVAAGDVSQTMPASPSWESGGSVSAGAWVAGKSYLLSTYNAAEKQWFYTFANNNTTHPTKLVIKGVFDADGVAGMVYSPQVVYYPVVVNKNQIGTTINGGAVTGQTGTIVRNCCYNITAVIKGKGVDDPAQNIEPAAVQLTLNVLAWTATFSQTVTFD